VIQMVTTVGGPTSPLAIQQVIHIAANAAWRCKRRHAGSELGLTNPGRHQGHGNRNNGVAVPAVGSLPAE